MAKEKTVKCVRPVFYKGEDGGFKFEQGESYPVSDVPKELLKEYFEKGEEVEDK